jgi:hypothetical protein
VNVAGLTPVPLGVVTLNLPVVAPVGTVIFILVAVSLIIGALTPWMVTDVAPSRAAPLMVTVSPTAPDGGLMLVIAGAGTVTRPMELSELVNQSAPSGPVVIPPGMLVTATVENAPEVVILPRLFDVLPNQMAPSGPEVIDTGLSISVLSKVEMTPDVVIRPIELLGPLLVRLVNHSAPSGPEAIIDGLLMSDPVKVETAPDVEILPIDP